MRRVVVSLVLIMAFVSTIKAQYTPNVAISLGVPVGDINKTTSLALALDGYYMKYINDSFDLGVTAGYAVYLGKDYQAEGGTVKGSSQSFLPIAAAFRYKFGAALSVGTDVGYAVGLGNNGGFYYKPMVGYDVGEKGQIMLSLQGISADNPNANSIGIGYSYAF